MWLGGCLGVYLLNCLCLFTVVCLFAGLVACGCCLGVCGGMLFCRCCDVC